MRYSIWGITYDAACALMGGLRAKNILTNITVGELAIYPEDDIEVKIMQDLELNPVSMDDIVDDQGKRLVENLRGTSWNAIWAGFNGLKKTFPEFKSPSRKPINAVIVGAGPVGRLAAEASGGHRKNTRYLA